MSRPIRVLLADDHAIVREGVRGMLDAEPDIEVVADASSGSEAIAAVAAHDVDVVLMDLRMPRTDGVAATAEICSRWPTTAVVILTTYETDADILRAVDAGAAGYLLKDVSRADLIGAVRAAAAGEAVLTPTVAARLMRRVRDAGPPRLSRRELDVLELVAIGNSNADIGRALFVSEATVKTHLLRIFAKLDVSDRTAAVTTAMSLGLLPRP
ncbi:MAG: response regulator transcription factor [Micropruina sp.]|uniref:response regulator n=1 Tax=Micropruina sp. TaxID=2737536 RepID=UPI0039E55C1F